MKKVLVRLDMLRANLKILPAILVCLVAPLFSAPSAAAQRIMPPAGIKCDPNHLTSFSGRILSYRRSPGRVSIRMRTDEETTESFTLRYPRGADAALWFLMRGEPFKPGDWRLVERTRYSVRPNMRATVWVCDDHSTPVVDWRPGEGNTKSVY